MDTEWRGKSHNVSGREKVRCQDAVYLPSSSKPQSYILIGLPSTHKNTVHLTSSGPPQFHILLGSTPQSYSLIGLISTHQNTVYLRSSFKPQSYILISLRSTHQNTVFLPSIVLFLNPDPNRAAFHLSEYRFSAF